MGSPRRAASMACPSSTGPATGASVETNEDHAEHQQPGPLGPQVRGEQAHIRTMRGPCHGPATLPARLPAPGRISPRARLASTPMLLAATTFDRDKAELLALLFLAGTGLWAGVLMLLAGLTTVPDVEPTSSGLEVGGDESPAIVGALTNGWRFDRSAAAATLIDLAARRRAGDRPDRARPVHRGGRACWTDEPHAVRGQGRAARPRLGARPAGPARRADPARRRHRHRLVPRLRRRRARRAAQRRACPGRDGRRGCAP